jgi:hypothetical protein
MVMKNKMKSYHRKCINIIINKVEREMNEVVNNMMDGVVHFIVIHNPLFKLRKVFLMAQFKRYRITMYEFINIENQMFIASAYLEAYTRISNSRNNAIYCIIIDNVLITSNLLHKLYFSHHLIMSSDISYDIIFINPVDSNSYISMSRKYTSPLLWFPESNTSNNYSACFFMSKKCAKYIIMYHTLCLRTNEYKSINDIYLFKNKQTKLKEQTLLTIDKWLFEFCASCRNNRVNTLWLS